MSGETGEKLVLTVISIAVGLAISLTIKGCA
jgi:hypothetical protein